MSSMVGNLESRRVSPFMVHEHVRVLDGCIFGRLTILNFAGIRNGHAYWTCRCECGVVKEFRGSALTGGKAQSCGCLMVDVAKLHNLKRRNPDPWVAEMNTHIYRIEWDRQHKKCARHKTWFLTLEEYRCLSTSPCHYCGLPPATKPTTRILRNAGVLRNGIDRVDNAKGYEMNNVVSCCERCNREKGRQKHCDFIENTIRRYEHMRDIGFERYGVTAPFKLRDELRDEGRMKNENHRQD